MPMSRAYLLQEELRETWIFVRVILGTILHVHQEHLHKKGN